MTKLRERPSALLVDDNPQVLHALMLVLDVMGWSTSKAAHSEQALAMLREKPFDLAIIDFKMPDINGIELCRLIRDQSKEKAPMIFILSGYLDAKSHEEALRSGAWAILSKPIGLDDMKGVFKKYGLSYEG